MKKKSKKNAKEGWGGENQRRRMKKTKNPEGKKKIEELRTTEGKRERRGTETQSS